MVITLLCIFVTIAGAILHYKFENSYKYYDLDVGGLVCMLLGGLATFIVVVVIIIGHTGVDASIYKAHMQRESIIKQIECVVIIVAAYFLLRKRILELRRQFIQVDFLVSRKAVRT